MGSSPIEGYKIELLENNAFHSHSARGFAPTSTCSVRGVIVNDNLLAVTLRTFTIAASGNHQHDE